MIWASDSLAMRSDLLSNAGPMVVWLIVMTFVFLECALIIGLFLPGDSLLITAGIVLAAHHAPQQVWTLALGAMIAAIAGNQVGYVIGRRAGSHLTARKGSKYLTAERLIRIKHMLERHGFIAVMVSRWIPWVRTLCPMVAGAAKMDHRMFTVASTVGAIVWAPVLLLLGFYSGEFLEQVEWLMPTVLAGMFAVLVVATVLGIRHYAQEMRKETEEVDEFEALD
ncbi:MAG: DedA family protein [Nocardiaceae bacterium]|nr:DedA family protein [Nocardiaceae bacterium]